MTDINATVERIKSANAVPSTDSFPSGAWSSSHLLVRIDERNETMTDTLTPVRQIDPSKPPRRSRGPIIALAVAAALILILGVVGFNVLTGDSQPDVVEPVPTTTEAPPTTTTAAPATTLAPESLQSPLPPDTSPLEMVDALAARWNSGAVDLGWALFHPDTEAYLDDDFRQGVAEELHYRYATRMVTTSECEVRTPPQLVDREPRVPGAQMVTCNDTIISGLDPDGFAAGGLWALEVADGWIHDFFILDFVGALQETSGVNAYRAWMQEHIPDRYVDLFDQATLLLVVDTSQAREGHRELVPFFVADTGPRPELALPADTPLLDVVAEFNARFAAGDVPGYEAIIHPAIGYPSGNDAVASWFGAVTGMTTERTCTQIDAITLRCDEVARSGLVPGQIVSEHITEFIGRNGWILAINFPDGPSPLGLSDPGNAPGVAEYRDWVRDNAPDDFDQLFVAGLVMRLDTEDVRELHKETIAAYLAATN